MISKLFAFFLILLILVVVFLLTTPSSIVSSYDVPIQSCDTSLISPSPGINPHLSLIEKIKKLNRNTDLKKANICLPSNQESIGNLKLVFNTSFPQENALRKLYNEVMSNEKIRNEKPNLNIDYVIKAKSNFNITVHEENDPNLMAFLSFDVYESKVLPHAYIYSFLAKSGKGYGNACLKYFYKVMEYFRSQYYSDCNPKNGELICQLEALNNEKLVNIYQGQNFQIVGKVTNNLVPMARLL